MADVERVVKDASHEARDVQIIKFQHIKAHNKAQWAQ
jgi:hypothetical protein